MIRITWFALYCGFLLSISAFSIDIILPAFLAISDGLEISVQQLQLIVPVYMIALGLGNPLYGALSDRIGRRPGIFIGLSIYLFGSVICGLASSLDTMLIGRFFQGFGAAAAPVLCRAMIRDRFEGMELAQNMAIASMFFALGPMLAPLLGFGVYALFGWRAVFGMLVLVGLTMVVATWFQQETLAVAARRKRGLQLLWDDTLAIIRHPQSRHFIILSCFCTAMVLTFLTHAPVIYDSLGAGSGVFATMFALCSLGIVAGQVINHRLIKNVGAARAATYAAWVIAATALVIFLASANGHMTTGLFTALMFSFNSCYLIVYSNFASLTLEPHGERAGSAAAMFGLLSYLFGSMIVVLVNFITDAQLTHWALCFVVLAVITAVGARRWSSRLSVTLE
ncbi:hypothetical protein AB833_05860 [Chromatiales bacterium (ex Bugula neritina AB1)]|nr:hypothetical protein AB833_05860 [Chromatiales bacterium (ex Bugula neritina AB1)]